METTASDVAGRIARAGLLLVLAVLAVTLSAHPAAAERAPVRDVRPRAVHWNVIEPTAVHWNGATPTAVHWNGATPTAVHWNGSEPTAVHWNALAD